MRWLIATLICAMSLTAMPQSIPRAALTHKANLTRIAHAEWGLDAPIATFAAQIQQESAWNSQAVSRVGAKGMAQFMPATATWWCSKNSISVINCQPTNPIWAMRSLVQYDLWLYKQIRAVDHCQQMAMTLSAFNGGLGWVFKDKTRAFGEGLNPHIYFDQVELVNAGRSTANFKENRDYPRRILFRYEALYLTWGKGSCTGEVLR